VQFHTIVGSITEKRMIPCKVFQLDIGNDLEISYKWYSFGVDRSKVKVRVRVMFRFRANSSSLQSEFQLYEWLCSGF